MKLFYRIRAWLTLSRRCAWCNPKRTLRRAWLHRSFTDTICQACERKFRLSMVKVMRGELAEPEKPFIIASHAQSI